MPRLSVRQRHQLAIAPALIAAATKEGQLTWYTSADLQLAEKVGLRTDVSGHSCSCRASRRRAYLFARGAGKCVRAAGIMTDRGAEPRTEIRDRISSCRRPGRGWAKGFALLLGRR